ncbi:MAG: peptidoglycan editing factor PgeF [Fervidobacterium sp.]
MPYYGNYVIKDLGGVVVAQSKLFLNFTNIKHYFTTRKITSQEVRSCLSELNMAVSDENFPKNFELFSKVSGIDPHKCVFSHQVHDKNIKVVTSEDIGQPYWNRKLKDVDGLITNEKGLFLVTTYADCMPILAYDPVNTVVGVAHSGWRGTLIEIAKELILKMNTEFGSQPEDIFVTVGPSIGPESFEVGKDVATEFFLKFGQQVISEHRDKIYVNLWKAIEITLKSIGVKHMEFSMIDTYKCTELFYSYRKEKTKKRFANIIGIE